MNINRRGFMGAILAACAAPAVVRSSSLMPVKSIVVPGDGEFDEIIRLLNAHNEIVAGRRTTIRTGLSPSTWRTINGGVSGVRSMRGRDE